jgi:hypothetical protein
MAELRVDGGELIVHLSLLEKLGAFRGDVRVPLAGVYDIRVIDDLWTELRGVRAPGTGWPGVIALGVRRGRGVRDFAAIYGRKSGIVVDLRRAPFGRLVVSTDDPSEVAERVAEARTHVQPPSC